MRRLIATLVASRDSDDSRIGSRLHYALTEGFATVELMPEMRERILWVLAEANGPLAELRGVLADDFAHRRGLG